MLATLSLNVNIKNKKLISIEMAMGNGWTESILKAGYIKKDAYIWNAIKWCKEKKIKLR